MRPAGGGTRWRTGPPGARAALQIQATHAEEDDQGAQWAFELVEVNLPPGAPTRTTCNLSMYDDSWKVFADIPEFFAVLATRDNWTLQAVRDLLDLLGAVDVTKR